MSATTTTTTTQTPPAYREKWVLQASPIKEKLSVASFQTCTCPIKEQITSPVKRRGSTAIAESGLPEYCDEADEVNEPDTVAKALFKMGFLFPLLWVMGIFILCMPLRAYPLPDAPAPSVDASSHPHSSSSPSSPPKMVARTVWAPEAIALHRRAEKHWAYRCLWALTATTLILTTIIFAAFGTHIV